MVDQSTGTEKKGTYSKSLFPYVLIDFCYQTKYWKGIMHKSKGLSGLMSSEFEISNVIINAKRSPGVISNQDKITHIGLVFPGWLKMRS